MKDRPGLGLWILTVGVLTLGVLTSCGASEETPREAVPGSSASGSDKGTPGTQGQIERTENVTVVASLAAPHTSSAWSVGSTARR